MATASPRQRTGTDRSRSLHVGLNEVGAAAYGGWTGPLAACEFDARDMAALAAARGIRRSTVLLTAKATRGNVLAALRAAAKALQRDDFFFLSYSGHGGQVPDVSGDEADRKDETWCLFDGQLIDDELYLELGRFEAGVRILVLSDSCHSGSVTRAFPPPPASAGQRPKLMPDSVAMRVYREHREFYDKLQQDVAAAAGKTEPRSAAAADPDAALSKLTASHRQGAIATRLRAAVLLVSGCQDNQTSMDGDHNGAFTEQLLKVWNEGRFDGSYAVFHERIRAALPPTQSPNLMAMGRAARFVRQSPFTL